MLFVCRRRVNVPYHISAEILHKPISYNIGLVAILYMQHQVFVKVYAIDRNRFSFSGAGGLIRYGERRFILYIADRVYVAL